MPDNSAGLPRKPIFAVAPMLDWTDRHCRYFYRQFTAKALLYTEMVVADAVIHGNREKILGYSPIEHKLALQLGGSNPQKLAEAARIGEQFGYDEINLNVGCPSDRVQAGTFGACLMLEPGKVAQAVEAMKAAVNIPVTIKCRIGVDNQDSAEALDNFAEPVRNAGADGFWIHARKVWLNGLSPKENREIPPLDYQRVYDFKNKNQNKFIGINGGIVTIDEAKAHLKIMDGVMLGRAVYHNPALLADVDSAIYGTSPRQINYAALIDIMTDYAEEHCAGGGRVNQVTRHMIGLFHGVKGAKIWRQVLSGKMPESASPKQAASVLREAFSYIDFSETESEADKKSGGAVD